MSSSSAVAASAEEAQISPAARVFGIAELVENILLHASEIPIDQVYEDCRYTARLPAKNLFGLQRVNTLFKDTIERNSVMQERMYLRVTPTGPAVEHHLSPVIWMVHLLATRHHRIDIFWGGGTLNLNCVRRHRRAKVTQMRGTSAWLRPEASWRKMIIRSSKSCAIDVIRSDSRMWLPSFAWDQFSQDTTLGQLADWAQRHSNNWDEEEQDRLEGCWVSDSEEESDE